MKKPVILIITLFSFLISYGQTVKGNQIDEIASSPQSAGGSNDDIKSVLNGIINDPDLHNGLWKNLIDWAVKRDSAKWKFLKDINLQFKTFQATDNSPAALGFTYDFNFNYAHFQESGKHQQRISSSLGFSANGNVAFNKKQNPTDFLETKVNYNLSGFSGGVIKTPDTATSNRLNEIMDKLVLIKDMQSKEAEALWEEYDKNLKMSNQYYWALSPKFALESNQDFSKIQWTSGLAVGLGAKAWNDKNIMAKLNVFDYPFALTRWLTGTDKRFTPYGSTIPTAQFTADYVIPANDVGRKSLVGNLNPYPRIKFEAGFRTIASKIKNETIFFNANFRYYQEINAPVKIKEAKLNTQTYFVMALQSTSGFFISYAKGKLPFDAKKDEVYSIGFNYKL